MIDKIVIKNLLPLVFTGMEETEAIRSSQIWEQPPFVFERNCRLCIRAESGGGKSSLLSFIYGSRSDYKGDILFDDIDARSISIEQWCRIRSEAISMLPQDMGLFPELTVAQNIHLKNNRTKHKSDSEIRDMLARTGIAEKYDIRVRYLSIGQQQRVAFIRALCQPFDFIFLDEPVSHLDARNNKILADMVSDEARRQNSGIIATSVGNNLLLDDAQFISL